MAVHRLVITFNYNMDAKGARIEVPSLSMTKTLTFLQEDLTTVIIIPCFHIPAVITYP